jgi:outer membrane protein OmpA-like peptidoglycan-associated protein
MSQSKSRRVLSALITDGQPAVAVSVQRFRPEGPGKRGRKNLMRPSFRTLCVGLVVIASAAALQGTASENVAPHERFDNSNSTEALENCRLVSLTRVHFGSANAGLTPGEETTLRHLVERYGRTNRLIIELRGYTDATGSVESNLALSTKRAQAIARFLIENGIPQQRIQLLGLGEIDDSAPNPEHRRVDVRIFLLPADNPDFAPAQ